MSEGDRKGEKWEKMRVRVGEREGEGEGGKERPFMT